MILEQENRVIERSEGFIETEFKISSSAHVMRILRTGIYSRKELAILREASGNAFDAHVEAGIKDRPIEITLPNHLEPTLKIRDYGNSMSHEIVMQLYSVYGLSTKSTSNDYIGMMGIGKFAGFAYAPAFQVSCIQNKVKRVYNMYLDESDKGAIALLMEIPTEEENGTEVSIEVKSEDIRTFVNEAKSLFPYWEPTPIIKGNTDYVQTPPSWHLKNETWGFRKSQYGGASYIVMGGVPYVINGRDIPNLTSIHQKLIDKQLVIFCNIGDVDVSASREQVSYSKKSVQFIKDKLAQIESEIKTTVESKMGSINSEYEARKFWYDLFQEQGELNVVKDIIKGIVEIKFNGMVIGGATFDAPFRGVKLEFYRDKQYNRRISCKDANFPLHVIGYPANEKENEFPSTFVDFGEKGRGKLRNYARFYLTNNNAEDEQTIIVLQPKDQKEFEEWITQKGIPSEIFKNIDEVIQLPPKQKTAKEKSLKPEGYNCWVYDPDNNVEDKYEGENVPETSYEYANIDFDEPGYYLVRQGKEVPNFTYGLLKELDPKFKNNPVIHIVTSRYVDKLNKNGWLDMQDRMRSLIQKEWDATKIDKIYYSRVSYDNGFNYERGIALKNLLNDKKITNTLIESFFNLVHFEGVDKNLLPHYQVGLHLGCFVPALEPEIQKIKSEAEEIWKKILDSAPLMKHIHCSSWDNEEVLPYLQEKLNNQ